MPMTFADQRIVLPVSDLTTLLNMPWTFANQSATGVLSTSVATAPIALTALLQKSLAFVKDRRQSLYRHRHGGRSSQGSSRLLIRSVRGSVGPLKQPSTQSQSVAAISPALRLLRARFSARRHACSVTSYARIAIDLATDCRFVQAKVHREPGLHESPFQHRQNLMPSLLAEMTIGHRAFFGCQFKGTNNLPLSRSSQQI